MTKYKLNVSRDIDTDEPGVYILNLPAGFKFTHDAFSIEHVRAYDSMKELRQDVKDFVAPCSCKECATA